MYRATRLYKTRTILVRSFFSNVRFLLNVASFLCNKICFFILLFGGICSSFLIKYRTCNIFFATHVSWATTTTVFWSRKNAFRVPVEKFMSGPCGKFSRRLRFALLPDQIYICIYISICDRILIFYPLYKKLHVYFSKKKKLVENSIWFSWLLYSNRCVYCAYMSPPCPQQLYSQYSPFCTTNTQKSFVQTEVIQGNFFQSLYTNFQDMYVFFQMIFT